MDPSIRPKDSKDYANNPNASSKASTLAKTTAGAAAEPPQKNTAEMYKNYSDNR